MLRAPLLAVLCLVAFPTFSLAETPAETLAAQLRPWLNTLAGKTVPSSIRGTATPRIDGQPQEIRFRIDRYDDQSFDLAVTHPEYAVEIRRRAEVTVLALPKHQIAYVGKGELDPRDHLAPDGVLQRLISPGTALAAYSGMVLGAQPGELADTLIGLANLKLNSAGDAWVAGDVTVRFANSGRKLSTVIEGVPVELELGRPADQPPHPEGWAGFVLKPLERAELERQLTRGVRRAFEILAPSSMLTNPPAKGRQVEHGELRWIDGQRVVLLHGSPEEVGTAHGKLLAAEAQRCIDSVLYTFGTAQTIASGRWFRADLEEAYARLQPYIPERHKAETRALARSLGQSEQLVQTINVFPELFHCSGFAVFGQATRDGKLYHGRVLDYMTTIGLQDAATTFIVSVDGQIPFANVGYAGFIGSVSGMNAEKISLGEMGGRGEGQWDGVPMATLMRRALEECSSLEQVKQLWRESPRTCEYYYVFADGNAKTAVGVAATPDSIQFVGPGESHELLGEGIPDAIVLSAGGRLEELRRRVTADYGKIDADIGRTLMCRPVAMNSNLHNVLFVPEDGILYIANADHKLPAADRPYVRLDLNELLRSLPPTQRIAAPAIQLKTSFKARDSLQPAAENVADAQACLTGLLWQPGEFDVRIEAAKPGQGDFLVRFPSACPSGVEQNDLVAMEWYQAKDRSGQAQLGPAAVVVHESGSGMNVGRLVARGLSSLGIHAFMIQMPHYGVRRGPAGRPTGHGVITAMRQAIADTRRAHDAVASLPLVDAQRISLQGTSLGGFVTATTAGLDHAYHRIFILLAGGDLHSVLMQGERDAAKMREELTQYGVDDATIKDILNTIEPLRLAHRIDPARTWLYSGQFDNVVPPRNSRLLAEAAHLPADHHVQMLADHYSGILFLPLVLEAMRERMVEPRQ
jgi:hypothetical protein